MTLMEKTDTGLDLTTVPKVLLVLASGKSIDIYIEGNFSLAQINRLHQIAATVFVEQGFNADTTSVTTQAGPNPHRRVVLSITLIGNTLPNLKPLIELLKPRYTATASLAVRPSRMLHYKLFLPARRTLRADRALALKNGPRGASTKGSEVELWLTKATTNAGIWEEAQRIADLAKCLIIGDIFRY